MIDETVTESCGCVFCDLGLAPDISVDGKPAHAIWHRNGKNYDVVCYRRATPPPSPAGEGWQTVPKEPTDFLVRLREANISRDREYRAKTGGEPLPVLFRTTELAGEVGELLNVIKKMERERLGWVGKRADRKMMLEEFGGVMACLDLLAMALDVDLASTTAVEFNKVSDRLELSTRLAAAPPPPGSEPSSALAEAMEVIRWYANIPKEWTINDRGLKYDTLHLLGEKARAFLAAHSKGE